MAYPIVQSGSSDNGTTNTQDVFSWSLAQNAGDLLYIVVYTTGPTVSGVTDTSGNVYHLAQSLNNGASGFGSLWYAYNIAAAAAGANTTTVLFTGSSSYVRHSVEYSGVLSSSDPLDVANNNFFVAGSTNPNVSLTTTGPGELIVGTFRNANLGGAATPGAGFSSVITTTLGYTENETQVAAGAVNVQCTTANGGWRALAAAFKPKPSGAVAQDPIAFGAEA